MAEVLFQFDMPLTVTDGPSYLPRACGREAEDGLWEGWIEFLPDDGSAVLRSRRETQQPNREDLLYWATGLTPVYLEGALERTLAPPHPAPVPVATAPAYSGPAPEPRREFVPVTPVAVLDPFSVYLKGEDLLRQELSALSAWHLRNIVRAYGLLEGEATDPEALTQAELVERIVQGVKSRMALPVRG
jgi:hypothetical protein